MKNCLHLCSHIVWAVLLSGCGGMLSSDQPPEHVYWLEPASLRLGEASTPELPDLIVVVDTIPGLDTDRILVKGPGARMNHYAGARWPDHLPEVLTAIVRLSLESTGRFRRISTASQANDDEWLLDLELREFFAVAIAADTPPEIRVQLAGYLNCGYGNTAVSATATAPTSANKLSSIVAAFQSATNDALTGLVLHLESACFPAGARSD